MYQMVASQLNSSLPSTHDWRHASVAISDERSIVDGVKNESVLLRYRWLSLNPLVLLS